MPDPSEPASSQQRSRQVFRRYLLVLVAPVAGILLALGVGLYPRRSNNPTQPARLEALTVGVRHSSRDAIPAELRLPTAP